MAKKVLRWPLKFDAAGRAESDTSHQTGIRLLTSLPKNTRLGRPSQGLSIALLEQATITFSEDKTFLLVTLLADIADFIPAATILGIDAMKDQQLPRKILINVKYIPRDDPTKIYQFAWRVSM